MCAGSDRSRKLTMLELICALNWPVKRDPVPETGSNKWNAFSECSVSMRQFPASLHTFLAYSWGLLSLFNSVRCISPCVFSMLEAGLLFFDSYWKQKLRGKQMRNIMFLEVWAVISHGFFFCHHCGNTFKYFKYFWFT